MTSTTTARALLLDLNWADGDAAATGSARFAFTADFDSAADFPDLPYDASDPAARYPSATRAAVIEVLDAAAGALGKRVPAAFAFVDAQLGLVMLRRAGALDGATSSSNRARVGSCVLTNIERPDDRVLVCGEALAHESVHHYLYRIERADGAFCDLGVPRRYRSPWSGNRIPLHSLVHACFVYYALLGLWCAYARTLDDAAEAANVRDRIARILFGYTFVRDIVDDPSFPRAGVQPAILDAIRRVADATDTAGLRPQSHGNLSRAIDACRTAAWIDRLAERLGRVADR